MRRLLDIVSGWLTVNRIRLHATLLATCLWSVYAVNMATPGLRDRNGLIKGTDFLHFYTLGSIGLRGRGDWLYSIQAQSALASQLVRGSTGTVFLPLYGPQVSLFFTWLALMPYRWALAIWLLLNAVVYLCCVYSVWRVCTNLRDARGTILAAALAFPGFFHLLAWGQTAGLALACFTAAFLALRAQRPWLAGLAIGCLAFKPQLALATAVVFLLGREGRLILGALASAMAQLAVAGAVYGSQVMHDYLNALLRVRGLLPLLEPRPYQTHCLRTFWSMLVSWPRLALGLYAISAAGILMLAIKVWKASIPLALRFSILLFATVLVSPHLTVYDLVILGPAFLLLADWAAQQSGQEQAAALKVLLYLCYPLFLLGPWAQITHIQWSVPVMCAITWVTYRVSTSDNDKRGIGDRRIATLRPA